MTPLLALLDVPVDDPAWDALDPPQRRQRTLEAVKRVLLRESQVQPLLLALRGSPLDRSESQALLDGLIESLPTARVLLFVNYRPEYQHGWGSKTYYTQLRIDPLPPESADELLSALVGQDRDPRAAQALLIERTEGNPFFLEESVRTLVETKVLVGERGAYRLAKAPQTLQIPATAQAILAARIDRLAARGQATPPGRLRHRQGCAVHAPAGHRRRARGESSPRAQPISRPPSSSTRRASSRISSTPSSTPSPTRSPTGACSRSGGAHSTPGSSTRIEADLSRPLGGARRTAGRPYVPGRGVGQGRDLPPPGRRQGPAARSANREALGYFETGDDSACGHLPERARRGSGPSICASTFATRSITLAEAGKGSRYLHEAEGLARALDDQRRLGWVSAYHEQSSRARRRSRDGRASVGSARRGHRPRHLGDQSLQVAAQYYGLFRLLPRRRLSRDRAGLPAPGGLARRRSHLRVLRPRGASRGGVTSRSYLARALAEQGSFEEGATHGHEALRIADALDHHPFSVLWACLGHAFLSTTLGEWDQAARLLERAVALCREWSITTYVPVSMASLGHAYAWSGRVEEGVSLLQQALALYESAGCWTRALDERRAPRPGAPARGSGRGRPSLR